MPNVVVRRAAGADNDLEGEGDPNRQKGQPANRN